MYIQGRANTVPAQWIRIRIKDIVVIIRTISFFELYCILENIVPFQNDFQTKNNFSKAVYTEYA